ncbi:MAG TPA: hypothetical protein VNW06_03125, partial [Cytophagaceae bacterium]|nr:hypothetical protein [Cytophagaceae bacterium]
MENSNDLINELNDLMKANPGRKYIVTIPEKFEEHCEKYFSSVKTKFHQTIFTKNLTYYLQLATILILVPSLFISFAFVSDLSKIISINIGFLVIFICLIYLVLLINIDTI